MLNKQLADELTRLVRGNTSASAYTLKTHSGDMGYMSGSQPDIVVYPESTQDVVAVADFCFKHHIPLIPYGGGTSIEGHIAAVQGGVCLDMAKMNRILQFVPEDNYVLVEAGLTHNGLNEFLESHGFYFPIEAGWGASIGGMMATNAVYGSNAMQHYLIDSKAVVCKYGQAAIINMAMQNPKSMLGYRLMDIFVGSEGTLGVITEIGLRIKKIFSHSVTIVCQFKNLAEAVEFTMAIKDKLGLSRVELLDKLQTHACRNFSQQNLLENDHYTVIIELAGNKLAVQEEVKLVAQYLHKKLVALIKIIEDKESAKKIWLMCKNALAATMQFLGENKRPFVIDVAVPLSQLAEFMAVCYEHMEKYGITATWMAHVGQNYCQFITSIDPKDTKQLQVAQSFNESVMLEAIKLGGSDRGVYGMGLRKKAWQGQQEDSLFLMQMIKKLFDPYGVLNPGKIIDTEQEKLFV